MNNFIIVLNENSFYTTVKVDGDILTALQEACGGFIEIVPVALLGRPYMMAVNDEGLIRGMAFNQVASVYAGQPICGPAAICKKGLTEDGEPDLFPLTEEETDKICAKLRGDTDG